jgi:dihydrofolate reductase
MAKPRKIVTFNNVTADGYFAAPDGNLDFVVPSDEASGAAMERAPDVDTMLFGRKTYEMFEQGWRDKDDDPHQGKPTDFSRGISKWINEHQKVVVSRSLKEVTWRSSRLLRDAEARTIDNLKREASGDLIVFGSGTLASRLTELGGIDEYLFIVNPVLLGGGRALLDGLKDRAALKLVHQRAFDSGHVLLHYRRA